MKALFIVFVTGLLVLGGCSSKDGSSSRNTPSKPKPTPGPGSSPGPKTETLLPCREQQTCESYILNLTLADLQSIHQSLQKTVNQSEFRSHPSYQGAQLLIEASNHRPGLIDLEGADYTPFINLYSGLFNGKGVLPKIDYKEVHLLLQKGKLK